MIAPLTTCLLFSGATVVFGVNDAAGCIILGLGLVNEILRAWASQENADT